MKNIFLKTGLTLLCLIIGLGSAWGETASIELCTSWSTALAYATEYTHDYTINDLNGGTTSMTLEVQGVYRQGAANTYFQMNKKSGYFRNTTKLPGKIKKIETTWSATKGATKCYFAENAVASSSDKTVTVTAATSVTYTPPTDADYYYFNIDPSTGSGSAQMTSCIVYYESVSAATPHTAHFSINGTIDNSKDCSVAEGETITFPTGLDDINGKKFMGWVSSPIDGTTKTAPTFVTSPTMGTSDVTYYAVYATASGSEQTYHLTQNEIKASTAHSSYSDITVNSASGTWTGKAIVNTATGYIQINKNSSNYNLCTPEFSAPITKIDIYTTNNTQSGRTFYLRSDNLTAQPSSSPIGSASLSEAAGSVSINVNSPQPLNQLYIYSSGAVYISNIDVTCGSASYSDYCTTVDTSTPSITANNTLEIPAAETDGTFNVTWTGFGDDMIEVNLYNNEACTVAFNGDWFEVELDDDNNVYYLAGENTSTSPRTVYMQLFGLDSEANEYTHVVTVTQAGKQGDPEITNFIKTSTLELVVGAPDYDIRNCLNIPSDYDTSTYAITTTINGFTQKDGEYACVYPYIAFSKAGEYTVHVVAAAMPGKYAQTEGDITVNVTAPAAPITTIPDLFTKATEVGGTETDINITFNNWVVSGVKDSNAYVTDGTNGFIIYQSGHGFTAGNVLNGTVACKVLLYNGAAEIKGLTSSSAGLTVTTDGTITPRTTTIDALENVNVGSVITLEGVSYDAPNLTDGENTIQPFTSLYNYPNTTFTQGTRYNVTGVYILYKSDNNLIKEILPRSAEDIQEIEAEKYDIIITPSSNGTVTASLEEAAEGVEVTLTVTPDSGYQLSNLTVTNASTSEAITVTGNKFIMPAADVNVTATFEEEETPGTYTYNLVTDASTLAAGDVIVLGCAAKEKAAGAMGSNSYLTSVDATISNGILSSKDAIEITLGGAAGAWTLTTSDGQITTSAAKAFKLNTGTQKTWTISITDGTATITGGSYGYIQYNPSSPRFLNYTSGQTAIEIYKKTAAETKTLTSITLDGQTTEFTEGSTFEFGGTVTAHYDDESTKDVTSSATFSGYDMSILGTEQTVTVSYTEGGVTKEASYNIIVNAVTKYTVTIETPENGTLVVMHGDDVVKTGDKFAEGETLNITATPAAGYKFRNWQAVDGTTHTFTSGTTWTMSASDVTIKANFDPADQKYLISWNVNGTVTNQQVAANSVLEAPDMTGKKLGTREFVGWTEDALVKNDTIPTYVTLGNATKDVTYYAVFADREEVTAAVPTSITAYADGNYYLVDKYVVEGVNHYYALDGNINQNNFIIPTDITAAVTENPDGSITINESNPIIKDAMKYSMSLTVEGNDSTIVLRNLLTNKVINKVTGSSNANNLTNNEDAASWTHFYAMPHRDADDKKSLPEQIADPNRFTLSTSTSDNWESHAIFMQYSSWNSTDQVQDVSPRVKAYAVGNRGIQPPKAQMYSAGYLYFVPATPIALSNFATHEVSVSQYGSTTLCMPEDYVMPEGLTGKIVTANEAVDSKGDGYYTLTFQTKYTAGDIVPAGECLVLSGNQGSYYIAPGETTAEVSDDNLLHGDYVIDTTDSKLRFITTYDGENASSNYYYKLATDKNKENFGWYWGNNTGEPFIMTSNERAYLVIDKGTAGLIRGFALDEFGEEDITTFIEGLTNEEINKSGRIYNLQGQMVNKLQKGINIVNGKKVIR